MARPPHPPANDDEPLPGAADGPARGVSGARPSLAGARWLTSPAVRRLFAALEIDGDTARVVGGAVRNTLLGVPVTDIDVATTALPETVVARAEAAGLKAIPTGIEHGTITVVASGTPFEVTTLREDVETFGRHATVRFGRDWSHDAARRDFTMNALYADRTGVVHDPTGTGYEDCLARRVRFIGVARRRIAEDYLRILRFFRFHAQYGTGELDAEGLSAVIACREGLRELSAERVGHEVRRIVAAPAAPTVVEAMADTGIIEIALGGVVRTVDFRRLAALSQTHPEASDPMLRLAVLACFVEEDVARLTARLRLSNAEATRMRRALAAAEDLAPGTADVDLRLALYRQGRGVTVDGGLVAWARSGAGPDSREWAGLLARAHGLEIPVFPLAGRDLLDAGVPRGPLVGQILRALEARWIASGFKAGGAELLEAAPISGN